MVQRTKMNAKKLLVSLVVIASALFLVATVSAAEIATSTLVEVQGMNANTNTVAVVAGETILVKVEFNALQNDSDVTVQAELEGEKVNVDAISQPFDVESGLRYVKVLTLKVPYELKDVLSDDLILSIELDGKDHKTTLSDITLNVQRPSYNADVKSVTVSQSVDAGETFPVDVVLKNLGYNDLDDVYVTVKIAELGIAKTAYFGDLVAIEQCTSNCDDEDEDTVSGRIYLSVPYEVKAGIYTVEVEVGNDDTATKVAKQIVVENDFANSVIATSSSKSISAGEDAVYELLIVNPTNKLKVYSVISESSADIASSTDGAVVAVPAGSSKTVKVTATANKEGTYNFNVNVFSGEKIADKVALSLKVEGKSANSPVILLTIVLAVVFLVLLVVLIVLLGKKPQKEEFGESYY